MKHLINVLSLALLIFVLPFGASATPALSIADFGSGIPDGPWTLGWQFNVNSTITVSDLGAFDDELDDFTVAHDVGLWTAGGTLLASTKVNVGDPLVGNFRYHSIAPLVLGPGHYVVGANKFGQGGDTYTLGVRTLVTPPETTFLASAFAGGGALQFPGSTGIDNSYFGGNFLFSNTVPEPTTILLLGLGLAGLGFAKRRPY